MCIWGVIGGGGKDKFFDSKIYKNLQSINKASCIRANIYLKNAEFATT